MSSASYSVSRRQPRLSLAHQARIVRVIAGVQFKMKYAGSAMGYAWSLVKPLSYFGVLYLVVKDFFNIGGQIEHFPLYLLIGIVLYTFFIDAIGLTLPSIANSGSLLRRLAFPAFVIPLSMTLTACITFCVNLLAVVVFVAASRVAPEPDWLLLLPLLAELYVFILGIGLIAATLYVRFRDVGQIWELVAQLLFFAAPIMYPVNVLPSEAQKIAFLNPFVQIMQDIRVVMLGSSQPHETVASVLGGSAGRLAPIGVVFATFLLGLVLFRHDAPRFAERV